MTDFLHIGCLCYPSTSSVKSTERKKVV